jgi:hypothetical protein
MEWKRHVYRMGPHVLERDDLASGEEELEAFIAASRRHIEPWLSAVFQAEHLNLLVGSGLTGGTARPRAG